jgi:hypothetical protein
MDKEQTRARIEEIGIIPAIRVSSAEDARFAAEAVYRAGLPIVEITMTVPGAIDLIAALVRDFPEMVVGAGTVLDLDTARRCLNAGASFLTSTGLDLSVVELAVKANRDHHRVEGRRRLRQGLPLRAARRRQLHQGVEIRPAADQVDCLGRRRATDSGALHYRGG